MRGHRFFAAIYDQLMAGTEKAGLSDMRAELLAGAEGRTLELGAGTGLNLEHYPAAVTELVLTEPDPHMAKRLRDRAASESGRSVEVVEAGAEKLPFDDSSFDTVVSTLCLCTVSAPERVVSEVQRVLRPGGRLLYLEHVRGEEGSLHRWQDRLETPWGWFTGGCHPNRDTAATLAASGLEVSEPERGELPKAPPLIRPLIRGEARLPSG